ncbi:MAG: uridine diphosphate-N-acetylglucosamine-binding protein YvcK [Chloroflexota bacterium]
MNRTDPPRRRSHFSEILSRYTAWLIPGIQVKRWFLLILLGITLLAVGSGILLLDIYRNAPDTWWLPAISTASLRFLPRPVRALIFGGLGLGMIVVGMIELNRSLIQPLMRPGLSLADVLRMRRRRERGPRIVAIGGGHGLSTLLRGIKKYSDNITAIVTVADDGGSSGRLRSGLGVLPPGDIRSCLAALSDDEAFLGQLFQYRFPTSEAGLDGHSFGNLFITALAEITGSFEAAVAESGRVLNVRGRVLPATVHDVRLAADVVLPQISQEVRVQGESQIPKSNGRVRHVWLEPNNPPAFPEVIRAILAAELIVIGPGSLYTSLLPNLLVPDLADAIRSSQALKVYVCNVATERGETNHFSCGDHIRVIEDHVPGRLFDFTLANASYDSKLPENVEYVRVEPDLQDDYRIVQADLVDNLYPWRHDSAKLAQAILGIFQDRSGSLVE